MAFKRRVYELAFSGIYEGLVVRARGASIGEYVETKAITSLGSDLFDSDHGPERQRLIEILVNKLIGWNLVDEDTGEPVPCTADQMAKEDLAMLLDITKAWAVAGFTVPDPLVPPSGGGQPSGAPEMPMETL